MEPGFPKRKIVLDRGYNVDYGGDGRYMWNINRVDKTVSVIDLSTNTTVSTIATPLINDFSTGNYVPADKCLYIHHSTGHYKIDFDPLSGTFCTIILSNANLATTTGNVVTYIQCLDAFVGVLNGFTARPRLAPNTSYFIQTGGSKSTVVGIAQGLGCVAKGGVNASNVGAWSNLLTNKVVSVGVAQTTIAPVINKRFYLFEAEYDEDCNVVRAVNMTGAQGWYLWEFCPRSNRLIGGGGNTTSGWRLAVIDHRSYTFIGNTPYINSAGAPNTTGYQYRDVCYNPYTGLVYAKPVFHAANTSDIHVYDCTQSLASMYQGAIAVGNDRVPAVAPYNNCTMGFNRLKNDEYYY